MRRILSLLLILSLMSGCFLFSCESNDKKTGDTDTTTASTTKPKDDNDQTDDPSNQYADWAIDIMDRVITVMEELDMPDYNNVVDKFFGDYSMSNFQGKNEEIELISRIYKLGDIQVTEYKSGETEYQSVRNQKLYTVKKASPEANALLASVEEYPYTAPLSIFSVVGFDMSNIYSKDEEDTDMEIPKLKYEHLFISEDRQTVDFSQLYLQEVAKILVKDLEEFEPFRNFSDNMKISGTYETLTQTVRISIQGSTEDFGDVKFETETCFLGMKFNYMTTSVSFENDIDGIKTTTTEVHKISDIYYENGEPCSVFISDQVIVTINNTQENIVEHTVANKSCHFKIQNQLPASFNITDSVEDTITSSTQVQEGDVCAKFYFSPFMGANLSVTSRSILLANIDMDNTTFQTPENAKIPQDVLDLLPGNSSDI